MTRNATVRGAALAALAALGIASAPAAGQGAGSAATTVLRIAPGPRPLSLGNAFVAVTDPLALDYNPAAVDGTGVAAAYQALPVGASAGAAVVAAPAGPLVLGLSLRFVDYGDIEVVEPRGGLPVGDATGVTATGGELTALGGAALRLGALRLGLAARWLRQDVAGLTDQVWAADAGALLTPLAWIALGLAVQNVGGALRAGRASPLPETVRVGAMVRRAVGGIDLMATVEGRRREARTGLGGGLELRTGRAGVVGAVRIGYESRPDPDDAFAPFVVGAGVLLDRLAVDLAYRALGPLGSTTQAGIVYRF